MNKISILRQSVASLAMFIITAGSTCLTGCDAYVDITPKGSLTIDSAYTYLELMANPMRCYYPSSFAYINDDLWAKESKIIGYESFSADGINFTFNEDADRTLISDNGLYENMYSDILRCNLVLGNIDQAPGTQDVRDLAKAYLFHRDWKKAEEAAMKSLAINNKLVDYNYINNNGGVARCREFAEDKNPEVLSYMWMGSGWTQEAATFYAYAVISPELIALYGDKDLRYSLFFRQSGVNITNYYDMGSGAAIWSPVTTSARFTYMTVGMRTAETMLILAEAYTRQGNIADAIAIINNLRKNRIVGDYALQTPSSQVEMMKIIITERRKELLFGFHRFFDLKRFNLEKEYAKTITRVFPVVTKTIEQKTYTLAPNSPLYIIPFPRTATDKNPNLTQNF